MKRFFSVLLIIPFALLSCHRQDNAQYSHPEYFDRVISHADTLSGLQPGNTLKFIDSAYNAFPQPGIDDLYRKYSFKSSYYIDIFRSDSLALVYADSMLWVIRDHVREKDFVRKYASALFRKGNILVWIRDYTGAFNCNYKARQAIESINDPCLLSNYTGTLAIISFKKGNYHQAAGYMRQALSEMAACPNDYEKFKVTQGKYDDIGIAYSKCGMLDSALYYFNLTLAYLDQQKDSFPDVLTHKAFVEMAQGIVYGNIGDIYLKRGDSVTAERLYLSDVRINSKKGYDQGDVHCSESKAIDLYMAQHRFKDAGNMLAMLRNSLDTFADMDGEIKWYREQLDYMAATGQSDNAFRVMKTYLKLKDSMANMQQIPQVDLQEEYAHIKKEYELRILEKQDTLKTYYLIIVLSCSVLAIIIALTLYYNWRRSKKMNHHISQQNNEMELALDSLTESQKENTHMMQVVAHDLKNPIASMISIISILLESSDLSADDREMLELMNTSSLHAHEMISDLMNINTTAEGMKKEPVEIQVLLRYSVDLLQFKATDKKQQITLHAEPATLEINREKIWRVISNLIVNAIKFSPESSNIHISAAKQGDEYTIVVQDHGIGIPDKIKGRVFDMFTDVKRPGTAGEQSFGLGLSITRQIIEAHGGNIWFESKEGEGTAFYVSLPINSR